MLVEGDRLAEVEGMVVGDVRCRLSPRSWSAELPEPSDGLCLIRAGWFRRRSGGGEALLDATAGYFARAGAVEQVAGVRATFTWIGFSPAVFDGLVVGADRHSWQLDVSAALDLRHRSLLATIRQGIDRLELTERLLTLLWTLPPRVTRPSRSGSRPRTEMLHRRLVAAVQEALNCDVAQDLHALAAQVGVSPNHLCSVFHRLTNRTISHYRNQLRVRSVMEQLALGSEQLADLAASHGFADQAHMNRVFRQHTGRTPGQVRAALSGRC